MRVRLALGARNGIWTRSAGETRAAGIDLWAVHTRPATTHLGQKARGPRKWESFLRRGFESLPLRFSLGRYSRTVKRPVSSERSFHPMLPARGPRRPSFWTMFRVTNPLPYEQGRRGARGSTRLSMSIVAVRLRRGPTGRAGSRCSRQMMSISQTFRPPRMPALLSTSCTRWPRSTVSFLALPPPT